MVRAVADRAFLPTKNLLEQVGDMMILTGKTILSAIRPPYPYGGEFVNQFLFALRLCWFPLLISTIAFGYGAPGLQAANFLTCSGRSTGVQQRDWPSPYVVSICAASQLARAKSDPAPPTPLPAETSPNSISSAARPASSMTR